METMEAVDLAVLDPEIVARFWAKVNKQATGCWLWTASLRNKGYGAFGYTVATTLVQDRAHRFSWRLHRGRIPEGLFVLHNCPDGDNPRCVNPDHLWLGTNDQNVQDMMAKGRHVAAATYVSVEDCKYKRGTAHAMAKLTPELVVGLRADQASGLSYSQIASKYGIAIGCAWRIANRKVWKHVV